MASVKPSCTSLPYAKVLRESLEALFNRREAPQNLLVGGNVDIVFGEIDARPQEEK